MTFQEQLILKNLQDENAKLKKENEIKEKENKFLKSENKSHKDIIKDLDRYDYRGECLGLRDENGMLKKKVESLQQALELFKSKTKKDSSNSSKPSSTNGFKKVIQNNREKSVSKPGRKNGYVAPPPKYIDNPSKIVEIPNETVCSCGCGLSCEKEVRRQVIGIEMILNVTEYKGKVMKCTCGKEYSPKFPKGVNNEINYDASVKSSLVYLNTYANVPERQITEYLSSATKGLLNISPTTVENVVNEFCKTSKNIIEDIKVEVLNSPVINNDETPIYVNGKQNAVLGVFTEGLSLTEAFENRTKSSFEEMGILNNYTGTSVHDHNKIHEGFIASTQAECNAHPIRETKGIELRESYDGMISWRNLMIRAKNIVEDYKSNGKEKVEDEVYNQIEVEYFNCLDKWDEEYKQKIKSKRNIDYYEDERRLKTRLREYVDDHLRFLSDFSVPFTNNLAERGLRHVKVKLKIIGSFRSLKGAKNYCLARSIIDTCKKQKVNIFDSIESIFRGDLEIFEFQKNKNNEQVA